MAGDNPKCSFGDGVKILPDGINELSPHMFKVKQILNARDAGKYLSDGTDKTTHMKNRRNNKCAYFQQNR